MKRHGARAVCPLADPEAAFEDVPDLGELVLVQWMMRAGSYRTSPALGSVGRSGRGWKSIFPDRPGHRMLSHSRSST
jgi:hypothetical protein